MASKYELIESIIGPKIETDVLVSVSSLALPTNTDLVKTEKQIEALGRGRYIEITRSGVTLRGSDMVNLLEFNPEKVINVTRLRAGVLISAEVSPEAPFEAEISVIPDVCKVSCTPQVFAALKKCNVPFAVLSVLYLRSENGIVFPVKLEQNSKGNGRYMVRIYPETRGTAFLEYTLYGQKIIGDTPVSEKFPDTSEPFCGTAFIGKTGLFGEQALYSKILSAAIKEYLTRKIISAKLHIPVIYGNAGLLAAHPLEELFCSFETTWNNRPGSKPSEISSSCSDGHLTIELPVAHGVSGMMSFPDGIVLENKGEGCCILATADCCSLPQKLEICYER